MRYRLVSISGCVFTALMILILAQGCAKKEEQQEGLAQQIIPDSLSFTQKVERLIPYSLQNVQQLVDNHPDEPRDFAINLNTYLPRDEFFALFEGREFEFISLYHGMGVFSGIYPVDPTLSLDSTIALMNLEARTQLAENVRIGSEEVSNITDDIQRQNVEAEIDRLRDALEQVDEVGGVLFYGAEVIARPGDALSLMQAPGRVVRVVFPGNPSEGSWVRLSPERMAQLYERDRQTALQ